MLSLGHLSLHKQRKVCSRAVGGRKPLILILIATAAAAKAIAIAIAIARARATTRAFSPLRGASYFSLLVQRKDNQKKSSSTAEWLVKHTLPTRPPRFALQVHSAAGIFRRDIPVSSKNDAHPCAPPLRGPIHQPRRFGRGSTSRKPEQQQQKIKAKARARARAPLPNPPLAYGKGREQSCTWHRKSSRAALRSGKTKAASPHPIDLNPSQQNTATPLGLSACESPYSDFHHIMKASHRRLKKPPSSTACTATSGASATTLPSSDTLTVPIC